MDTKKVSNVLSKLSAKDNTPALKQMEDDFGGAFKDSVLGGLVKKLTPYVGAIIQHIFKAIGDDKIVFIKNNKREGKTMLIIMDANKINTVTPKKEGDNPIIKVITIDEIMKKFVDMEIDSLFK